MPCLISIIPAATIGGRNIEARTGRTPRIRGKICQNRIRAWFRLFSVARNGMMR
ncbi:hypothetical protein [Methylovulum psychrotolerans]|uniref:hypothetical protein n=1 Tax=Methylovulum psychrotolerans TaxID=1704499 RepID=UPI001B807021|nr:hypothetical protein [Methylovulum psychrotolerans]